VNKDAARPPASTTGKSPTARTRVQLRDGLTSRAACGVGDAFGAQQFEAGSPGNRSMPSACRYHPSRCDTLNASRTWWSPAKRPSEFATMNCRVESPRATLHLLIDDPSSAPVVGAVHQFDLGALRVAGSSSRDWDCRAALRSAILSHSRATPRPRPPPLAAAALRPLSVRSRCGKARGVTHDTRMPAPRSCPNSSCSTRRGPTWPKIVRPRRRLRRIRRRGPWLRPACAPKHRVSPGCYYARERTRVDGGRYLTRGRPR